MRFRPVFPIGRLARIPENIPIQIVNQLDNFRAGVILEQQFAFLHGPVVLAELAELLHPLHAVASSQTQNQQLLLFQPEPEPCL